MTNFNNEPAVGIARTDRVPMSESALGHQVLIYVKCNSLTVTGYTWGSVDDVNALFNYFLLGDPMGPGPMPEHSFPGGSFYQLSQIQLASATGGLIPKNT